MESSLNSYTLYLLQYLKPSEDTIVGITCYLYILPFFFIFSSHRLLEKTSGIEEAGGLRWELFGYLVISWVIVYLCIFKGVKSTGKVRIMPAFLQNVFKHIAN